MANYLERFSVEKTARILGVEPSKVFLWRIIPPSLPEMLLIMDRLKPHKTKEELKELQGLLRLCKGKASYDEDKNIYAVCEDVERYFLDSLLPHYGWRLWIYSP